MDKDFHNRINDLDKIYDHEKKELAKKNENKKPKTIALHEEELRKSYSDNKSSLEKEYSRVKSILSNLDVGATILESDYRNIFYKYEGAFTFMSGSEAVLNLLKQVNVKEHIREVLDIFGTLKGEVRKKTFKKLKLLIHLYVSKTKPEWMVLTHLPVIPPDLRPVVQLE